MTVQDMSRIHSTLKRDCIVLGRFKLCWLLMMNDSHYPWFILVPDRDDISEIHQLSSEDQQQLLSESVFLSTRLQQEFNADKMNLAALGNIVPQLHVHHVVRYKSDPAWPAPVWGFAEAAPYTNEALAQMRNRVEHLLNPVTDENSIVFHTSVPG